MASIEEVPEAARFRPQDDRVPLGLMGLSSCVDDIPRSDQPPMLNLEFIPATVQRTQHQRYTLEPDSSKANDIPIATDKPVTTNFNSHLTSLTIHSLYAANNPQTSDSTNSTAPSTTSTSRSWINLKKPPTTPASSFILVHHPKSLPDHDLTITITPIKEPYNPTQAHNDDDVPTILNSLGAWSDPQATKTDIRSRGRGRGRDREPNNQDNDDGGEDINLDPERTEGKQDESLMERKLSTCQEMMDIFAESLQLHLQSQSRGEVQSQSQSKFEVQAQAQAQSPGLEPCPPWSSAWS